MAATFQADYCPIGDEAAFTRAPMRSHLMRALQENARHFYGTRLRQVVADCGLWYRAGIGALSTEPEYNVTLSAGCERLWGTILWVSYGGLEGGAQLQLRFYTESGGAGVAAGLNAVTSATTTDRMPGQSTPFEADPETGTVLVVNPTLPARPYVARLWGGAGAWAGAWVTWAPDTTLTLEQRLRVEVQEVSAVQEHIDVWGVYVFEQVRTA